ncbi:hypothetical protein ONE63_008367 [Megalurothrips usitatus]|uniref:Uncharacterized protein n=1 Tax=Megalurothrips usitatus TaxID=439358 RepID=A0AAV7XKX0_9NEOP|nr:hypothetical protein ONE63_008367 [Megalurothrips usitatus]
MPQLNERPQPQPRHRYESIPQRPPLQHPPPQQPPPPPLRPGKATPTRRCNSSAGGASPRRAAPVRSPSTASLVRRGAANGVSTPAARFAASNTPNAVLSSPATSPLRLQQQQQQQAVPFVSPSTSRRNLTPLMNSMSPQPLPRTPRQQQQQPPQQYNHRRTQSSASKTAIIAPNTYTGFDLSGRAYNDGSRPRCELEDDMAEMQASFLSQQQQALQACSPASYKSNKSSWTSLPGRGLGSRAPRGVLFGTGVVLIVSGVIANVLSFYMLSQKGRQYYLDFGVLSAFASLMLGIIGLRSRVGHLLPNRNYVTGYILVAVFSVLTAAGLLALLLLPPPPHLPRSARLHGHGAVASVDMTAGAVCGTAALTLLLAATGTLTSYCCRYPPPDNRVAHAAEGFTV